MCLALRRSSLVMVERVVKRNDDLYVCGIIMIKIVGKAVFEYACIHFYLLKPHFEDSFV